MAPGNNGLKFYRYWGKAKPKAGAVCPLHLLAYHSLDVVAVASVWWDASPSIRRAFVQATGLSESVVKAWVLFFIALHDLGKLDLRFQLKARSAFLSLRGELYHGLSMAQCQSYDHGQGGLYWFENDRVAGAAEAIDPMQMIISMGVQEVQADPALVWIKAVTGHHGFVRQYASSLVGDGMSGVSHALREYDRAARQSWIAECESLFLAPHGLKSANAPPLAAEFSSFLAGFCSVCDWLGSRSEDGLFTYCATPSSLPEYLAHKLDHDALRVFEKSGIDGKAFPYAGVERLLKDGHSPHQLQTLIEKVPIKAGLGLIEGPTGSGKTEAALAMAWRLIAAGLADNIVFALPTQATSNAMYGRIVPLASLLFEGGVNVLVAHGRAAFNRTFGELKKRALTEQGNEEAWVQCAEWLASSRKRVFLGQFGVGTVDQVLMAVLPVKHNFVRAFGMGRSVLIVDEVHAYDEYMNTLLVQVLRQQRVAGGSAILLSATLPSRQRQRLMEAWGSAGEPSLDYPLLAWCDNSGAPILLLSSQYSSPTPERQVQVECLPQPEMRPDDELLARMVAAAKAGVQVGIICNLVDHAQETYQRLRAMTGVPLILFHSRFTFADRQAIETSLDGLFGPKGDRSEGRILVATQVLEQSIDIDMDWLITQLCPVDLLFQRLGRMHRHQREWRPKGFTEPLCTVLLPEKNDFGKHGAVYQNAKAMWRTWQKLLALQGRAISFPVAYRGWIEEVYAENSEAAPDWVTTLTEKFNDKKISARSKAHQQLCSAANPVADTDVNVMALTRDGEMSCSVLLYRDTAAGRVLRDGSLLPMGGKDFSPEEREVLALNLISAPASWKPRLPQADEEGVHWLQMQGDLADVQLWEGDGMRGSFSYDSGIGLRWNAETAS